MLITRTSADIAAEPWDIMSTAVRSLPGTVRRYVVDPYARVTTRGDTTDAGSQSTRSGLELPLRDHNAAPRKSMLGGAKLGHNKGHNIYLPIRRPLMRAQ